MSDLLNREKAQTEAKLMEVQLKLESERQSVDIMDEQSKRLAVRLGEIEAEAEWLKKELDSAREIAIDFNRCAGIAMLGASYWPESSDVWNGTVSQRLSHILMLEHAAREQMKVKLAEVVGDMEWIVERVAEEGWCQECGVGQEDREPMMTFRAKVSAAKKEA
jgi:hypothetical protein